MPSPPFDFNVQNNFPMSSVIQAAQENANRQLQAREHGQQSLVQGLGAIGQIGQSLLDRRRAMAQAMAGAQLYANTPEGKAAMAPTITTDTINAPVPRNTTAAYNPSTGSVTPNTGASGVGTVMPQPVTTSTPSPIDMRTLATAFMGESPGNMLTQLFERQKSRSQLAFEYQKLAEETRIRKQQVASQQSLAQALLGFKGKELDATTANNLRSQNTNLEGKKAELLKSFPDFAGTMISGVLPPGSDTKLEATFKQYRDIQNQIEQNNRQLYGGGGTPTQGGNRPNISVNLPGIEW